jgi:hypothetical protein
MLARHWWLTPVILATWKTEIRKIVVQVQSSQRVHETLSQKYPTHKKEVAHELEHLPRKPWVQTPELEKEMQTWESSFI